MVSKSLTRRIVEGVHILFLVIVIAFLNVGVAAYVVFLKQPAAPRHSLLLYTSRKAVLLAITAIMLFACSSTNTPKTYTSEILYTRLDGNLNVSAWVFNVDNGESWKIDDDLWAKQWSPSGEKILLDGNGQNRYGQIWVSSSDGKNLMKVFDVKDYPDLTTFFPEKLVGPAQNSFWLTNSIVLIQPEKGPIILYDIQQTQIIEVRDGAVAKNVSPSGEYWIEFRMGEYFLKSLKDSPLSLSQYGFFYHYISMDGKIIAYTLARDNAYYLAMSNIDTDKGLLNEKLLTALLSNFFGPFRWSPDNKELLYRNYDINSEQLKCIVLDVLEQKETYNQPCESKTDVLLWSPRSDGFLTQPNLQQYFFYRLDGSVQTLLEVPSGTSGTYQVVDWRLIEIP
jgi:hypothetical protein